MKTIYASLAAVSAMLIAGTSLTASAQGLFAKAGDQAKRALAAYESIWDDFYGKFDELLVAEAEKEDGKLEFDAEKGIAHFPVRLKVNEEAYAKWVAESEALLSAAGVRKKESEDNESNCRGVGPDLYFFGESVDAEIERAYEAGELTIPRAGVIVELVDEQGEMLQYAALPIGLFKIPPGGSSSWNNHASLPLYNLRRGKVWDSNKNRDDSAVCSLSFAGVTRSSLQTVADIKCRVLVDPEFTEEARRLALAKIKADDKVFSEHGIESKTILLPGGVPLAVNKTPKGFWFSRYEVTQAQWEAVMEKGTKIQKDQWGERVNMGRNPSLFHRDEFSCEDIENVNGFVRYWSESPGRIIDSPDFPIDYVPWVDVVAFVKKLNSLPEVKSSGLVFSIPKGFFVHSSYYDTPDSSWNHGNPHWEYACVGSPNLAMTARALFDANADCGLDLEGNELTVAETAWCGAKAVTDKIQFGNWGNSGPKLHPVGMKRPNGFGLYDMVGNAGEWVDEPFNAMDSFRTVKSKFVSNTTQFGFKHCSEYRMEDSDGDQGVGIRLEAFEAKGGSSSSSDSSSSGDMSELSLSVVLSETGFKFKELEGGKGYRATFKVGDGRTQMVLVDETVETLGDISVREIWSIAAKSETKPIDEKQMALLLVNSGGSFLGHWCLAKPSREGEKWLLYYSAKMPTSSTSDEMKAAVIECAKVADQFEKKLFGSDDN